MAVSVYFRQEFVRKYNIRKMVNEPFNRLTLKQRAVFILHLAGVTQREIRHLLRTDRNFVNDSIKKGYEEYYL